jgi:hypothetical protein
MEYVNVTKDVDVEQVVNALVHAAQKISKLLYQRKPIRTTLLVRDFANAQLNVDAVLSADVDLNANVHRK